MAHNVETMAYTNEVPWHGLGHALKDAPSVKDMLKAAKLDWRVDRVPMFLEDQKPVGADFAALRRSSDGKVLDIVGSRYQPVQNADAFEFFKEFVEAGKATMETAGSLRGGKFVWGLARLGDKFTLKNNDVVKGYLLLFNPHQQGKRMMYKTTSVRVVCNNTLDMAFADGSKNVWRMSHARKFDEAAVEEAKDALGLARESFHDFEKVAKKLQAKKLSREKVIELLAMTFMPGAALKDILADGMSSKMEAIMGAYEKAPGADPGNAWGALNAVTYYTDHMASRTPDKRLTNAWLGKTANQKRSVLLDLIEA